MVMLMEHTAVGCWERFLACGKLWSVVTRPGMRLGSLVYAVGLGAIWRSEADTVACILM
jgi:hypothetical protein